MCTPREFAQFTKRSKLPFVSRAVISFVVENIAEMSRKDQDILLEGLESWLLDEEESTVDSFLAQDLEAIDWEGAKIVRNRLQGPIGS